MPRQRTFCPDQPVRSLAEFAAFLAALEEMFGPDDRSRKPITGNRFLL
ncbi:MAG: hypothetical protein KIT14_07015 [bacterium]|nr:hypothetical protein [bacterium]